MNSLIKIAMFSMASIAVPAATQAVTPTNTPWTIGAGDVGGQTTLNFNGIIDETVVTGLTSSMTLQFTGVSANMQSWNFNLLALNNTTGPSPITSRLSSFGFNIFDDTTATFTGSSNVTGLFDIDSAPSGNIPMLGNFSICFREAGGNCAGGGSGGLLPGETATGSFTLNFSSAVDNVTLNNFFVRYQSIDNVPGFSNGNSGVGVAFRPFTPDPSDVVPEPGTWAMLIAGFGLVGASMRRRRTIPVVAA